MSNLTRLTQYYELLCNDLKENGYKYKGQLGDKQFELEFAPDYENLDLTIMTLTEDYQIYDYLNKKGLIDHNICHFCGDTLDYDKCYFTEPTHKIRIEICRECNTRGKIQQQVIREALKPKSGCFLIIILIMLFASSLIFIF